MTTTVRTIFSINATDRSHDFLVIRRGPAGISIEAQSREDEWESATAGPFTPEQLRAALDEVAPAGSYTRTDEDWKARAEKAEKERDEMRDAWEGAVESVKEASALINSLRAEQPRPLTAREHLAALWGSAHLPVGGRIPAGTAIITRSDHGSGDVRYQTLEATGRDLPDPGYTLERNYNYGPENGEEYRLLDPPARPEGAEKLAEVIDGLFTGDEGIYADDLADSLARCGVRVVTEEER